MQKYFKLVAKRLLRGLGLRPVSQFPFLSRTLEFQKPRGPEKHLSRKFFEPVKLKARTDTTPWEGHPLFEIWKDIPGAHKWHHYFPVYESAVSKFEGRPIRMLEIGVFRGGSLRMWRNYLHPESVIVGVDINPDCRKFESPNENLFIRIGDQSDSSFLDAIVNEFGPFDFILDDGSHLSSHMITSFDRLFFSGLKDRGVYLVEDTHCNYWSRWRDLPYSFTDLAKDLVDFLHAHYWHHQDEAWFLLQNDLRLMQAEVPRICSEIDRIEFEDSMITIHKLKKDLLPCSAYVERNEER